MRSDDAGEERGSRSTHVTPGNIEGTGEGIADDVLGDLADNELVKGEATFVVELLGKDQCLVSDIHSRTFGGTPSPSPFSPCIP
jgi:hypothetical protein